MKTQATMCQKEIMEMKVKQLLLF